MKVKFAGRDPELGKTFLSEHGPLAIVRGNSSPKDSAEAPPKYQDAQEAHDEQMPGLKRLPDGPTRKQFKTQAEYEEALAGWRSRVGRIKALAARKTEA